MLANESPRDRALLIPVRAAEGVLVGQGFAAIPLTTDTLRSLLGRCAMFRGARAAYPGLHATTEFDYTCSWHDTGDAEAYDDGDRGRIEALAEDDELLDALAGAEVGTEF